MEIKPNHIGLIFSQAHIDATQAKDDRDHIADAFALLTDTQDADPLAQAYKLGLRYRFMNDSKSGEQAVQLLHNANLNRATADYRQHTRKTLAWLSVVEMVRDLSQWQAIESGWFDDAREVLETLNQPPDDAQLLDGFWLGALNIGAGIMLEDMQFFQRGSDFYQLAIEEHIHPEGYLRGIVDEEDATDTYHKQVSGTAALVLMAEMATIAGADLWSVDNRGITPMTASTYTMYYYYYSETWQWNHDDPALTLEDAQQIMRTEGAFIEIANRRKPLRAIEQLLEDCRPFFNLYSGGLTTLTHGTSAPRNKRRWSLFGSSD